MTDFTKEINEYKHRLDVLRDDYKHMLENISKISGDYSEYPTFINVNDFSHASDIIREKSYELSRIAVEIETYNSEMKSLEKAMELND